MAARKKKTARKKTARKYSASRARAAIDDGLRDLEKRLPKNLKSSVRDLRGNLKSLQKQTDRLRAERDARWQKLETQVRGDIAKLLRRLEKAVAPASSAKSSSRRRTTARKKTARKPARRRATARKTTRRKTTRKKKTGRR